ncbi:MAG: DUF5047 domain-containing protein [Nocardioidaceae bacterium]
MQRLPGAALDLLPTASYTTRAEWSTDHLHWEPLEVIGGTVTCDRTSQVRWSADLTVPYGAGHANVTPYGAWVRMFRGVRLLRETPVEVPWGVYRVEQADNDRGTRRLTLSGLESALQDARFARPRTISGPAADVVRNLVSEVLPDIPVTWSGGGDRTDLPAVTEAKDRWGLIAGGSADASIAGSLGKEIFCGPNGTLRVVDVPGIGDHVSWEATSAAGVLVSSTATDTRDGVTNLWVVTGERTDGPPVGPAFAWDSNPGSRTYAGQNPLHGTPPGPFGLVTGYYSSPLMRNDRMCRHAANTRLRDSLGAQRQVTFTAVSNPALEAGDVVAVTVPSGHVERHLVDSWTTDLTSGVMDCTTRTTGAADE